MQLFEKIRSYERGIAAQAAIRKNENIRDRGDYFPIVGYVACIALIFIGVMWILQLIQWLFRQLWQLIVYVFPFVLFLGVVAGVGLGLFYGIRTFNEWNRNTG